MASSASNRKSSWSAICPGLNRPSRECARLALYVCWCWLGYWHREPCDHKLSDRGHAAQAGVAAATASAGRQLGSAFGVAVLGAVIFSRFGTVLRELIAGSALSRDVRHRIIESVATGRGTAELAALAHSGSANATVALAFSRALQPGYDLAGGFCAVGGLLAYWAMGSSHRTVPNIGVDAYVQCK